mmetsp:Transcript_12225/g.30984  ORF Transcript_12225/g.30984 Transcript_12225/m.30984 type:complete len:121 (-) Transcript_12225:264-626(-)
MDCNPAVRTSAAKSSPPVGLLSEEVRAIIAAKTGHQHHSSAELPESLDLSCTPLRNTSAPGPMKKLHLSDCACGRRPVHSRRALSSQRIDTLSLNQCTAGRATCARWAAFAISSCADASA